MTAKIGPMSDGPPSSTKSTSIRELFTRRDLVVNNLEREIRQGYEGHTADTISADDDGAEYAMVRRQGIHPHGGVPI